MSKLWHRIQTIQHRDEIAVLIRDFFPMAIICEVGVRNGENLETLLRCDPMMAVGIDSWDQHPHTYLRAKNSCGNKCSCVLIKIDSAHGSRLFGNEFFDFIYIDACHTYKSVWGDLRLWWPKLKKGGVFAGHDYFESNGIGVIQAVDEFAKEFRRDVHITSEEKPSWIMVKD